MSADSDVDRIAVEDVRRAAARLNLVAVRTPLLASSRLDADLGARVVCKAENLQLTGAFKFRGAYHRLALLSTAERARGVVAASSGNHAAAVALAAKLLGSVATVVVPTDAPGVKVAVIHRHGARIIRYD